MRKRARQIGIEVGVMDTGQLNAITDVTGVLVGHKTIMDGETVRTGVTAVLPHDGNLYQEKVPAAIAIANGFGKFAGYTQVEEVGTIETPIIITNTLNVGTAVAASVKYTLGLAGNENVRSVNAVVGEINDGILSDIRGMHVTEPDVIAAIRSARPGPVDEGCVGAGTGARTFNYKSGVGTSSRMVPLDTDLRYTVGVLVVTNYGGLLDVNGAPVGRELGQPGYGEPRKEEGGSCIIVIATDAPFSSLGLKRLARRAFHGLARTGSHLTNGSGDYAIAFSTAYRIPHNCRTPLLLPALLMTDAMTPFFQAVIEATQEAVYNSLFMAVTTTGQHGRVVPALPMDEVIEICKKYNVLNLRQRLK